MKVTVSGSVYAVTVSDRGVFTTVNNGKEIFAESLAGLTRKIKNAQKEKPVSIRVIEIIEGWSDGELRATEYEIVGTHGKRNFRTKGGQIGSYGLYFPTIDVAKVKRLHAAKEKAERQYKDYLADHSAEKNKLLEEIAKQRGTPIEDDE